MDNNLSFVKEFTKQVLALFDFPESDFSLTEEEETWELKIKESEESGFLIGYHGKTLEALEFILTLMVFNKTQKWQRVFVEVGNYQEKKKSYLEQIALSAVEKVKFLGSPVSLPPMSAKERRLVHIFLKDQENFETESLGEGQDRHIIIKLKSQNSNLKATT